MADQQTSAITQGVVEVPPQDLNLPIMYEQPQLNTRRRYVGYMKEVKVMIDKIQEACTNRQLDPFSLLRHIQRLRQMRQNLLEKPRGLKVDDIKEATGITFDIEILIENLFSINPLLGASEITSVSSSDGQGQQRTHSVPRHAPAVQEVARGGAVCGRSNGSPSTSGVSNTGNSRSAGSITRGPLTNDGRINEDAEHNRLRNLVIRRGEDYLRGTRRRNPSSLYYEISRSPTSTTADRQRHQESPRRQERSPSFNSHRVYQNLRSHANRRRS